MCSLKHEVKVKVTKFCIGREELIIVNKLTKFDLCIINGLWETKLNATAKRKLLTPDRQTDGFRQFIDRTCFAIRSITDFLHNTIHNRYYKWIRNFLLFCLFLIVWHVSSVYPSVSWSSLLLCSLPWGETNSLDFPLPLRIIMMLFYSKVTKYFFYSSYGLAQANWLAKKSQMMPSNYCKKLLLGLYQHFYCY